MDKMEELTEVLPIEPLFKSIDDINYIEIKNEVQRIPEIKARLEVINEKNKIVLSKLSLLKIQFPQFKISSIYKKPSSQLEKNVRNKRLKMLIVLYSLNVLERNTNKYEKNINSRYNWIGSKKQLVKLYDELISRKFIDSERPIGDFLSNFNVEEEMNEERFFDTPIILTKERKIIEWLFADLAYKTKPKKVEDKSDWKGYKIVSVIGGIKVIDSNNIWDKFTHVFVDEECQEIPYRVPNLKKHVIDEDDAKEISEIIKELDQ